MSQDSKKIYFNKVTTEYPDPGIGQPEINNSQLDPSEAIAVYQKIIAAKMGDIFAVDDQSQVISESEFNTEDETIGHGNLLANSLSNYGNTTVSTDDAQSEYLMINNGSQREFSSEDNKVNNANNFKNKKKKSKKRNSQKLKLQIAHQTSGRVRMKIASAKGNPELLKKISETFGVIPGIERVSVNSVTGSIILHYDAESRLVNEKLAKNMISHGHSAMPGSEIDELARKIESEAEFLAQRSEAARIVVDLFKKLDREIKLATNNLIDLKIVLGVGVIGLTILEMGANAATPVWLTLAIFTFNHFVELRQSTEEDSLPIMAPVIFKHA
jgi:hypothetical protein